MSDLISKSALQEAIEALSYHADKYVVDEEKHGFCTGIAVAIRQIELIPTIEPTLYGYKLYHLAFVAALLQNKGVTEENLADVLNCVDWVVGLVLDNMKERVIQSVIGQSKKVEPYAYSPSNCGAKMDDTPTKKVDIPTENTNRPTDEVEE